MRLLVSLIIAVSLMFGQIVVASPRDDAENIARFMISESNRASNLQNIASQYVLFLTRELGKHSVRVVDSERFAEMLPENEIEPWLVRLQEIYVDRLLEIIEPAKLAQLANGVRVLAENTDPSQTADGKDFGVAIIVSTAWVASFSVLIQEIKQSPPNLYEAPYLADILETDGIVQFPNRIWRKDLIAKIRGGG